MISRLFLLTVCSTGLSGCGTANHLLGQATGLVQNLTAPVLAPLGALRMADEKAPAASRRTLEKSAKPADDAAVPPPQR